MRSRRHRGRRKMEGSVELNLAAMLDMAFQLLTFFILTFRPSPVEGQISLALPPPGAVATLPTKAPASGGNDSSQPPAGKRALLISVRAEKDGSVRSLMMGFDGVFEGPATPRNLAWLDSRMKTVFSIEGEPFDEILIRAAPELDYEELLKILEICARQKLPDGTPLTKIGFVELPDKK